MTALIRPASISIVNHTAQPKRGAAGPIQTTAVTIILCSDYFSVSPKYLRANITQSKCQSILKPFQSWLTNIA